jgi:hypothetical protein
MSIVYLHLVLNHFPVIGAVLGMLLLGVALARGSGELTKVGLGFFGLIGAIAVIVYFTGEPAEELVERLPGFSETITERHEDVALIATVIAALFGALAMVALLFGRHRPFTRRLTAVAFIGSLGIVGLMGYTANLGGQIRHTEIRAGATVDGKSDTPTREAGEGRERR